MDSEFYALERALAPQDQSRSPGMPMVPWIERLARSLDAASRERLDEALQLHQRYRFDPTGLDPAERTRLRELCAAIPTRS